MTALEAIPKISELLARLIKRVKDRETAALVQQIQQHQLVIQTALMKLDAKVRELEKQLASAQSEEICIHRGIEFHRGKRTRGSWIGFCPNCHMPAQEAAVPKLYSHDWTKVVACSANCGWKVFIGLKLTDIALELDKA